MALLAYPAALAFAGAVGVVTSLVTNQSPPAVIGTSFLRGLLLGGALVGAAWWFYELARLFAEGAERDRKGADGEELTHSALKHLRRLGWHVIHDVEYPGRGNVDHVLVGRGGVIALDSKYTTERLWVTPKAIGGTQRNHIARAKAAARLAERSLVDAGLVDVAVEPALVFWGPGAPTIAGGHVTIQGTLVFEGRQARKWRQLLADRPQILQRERVSAVLAILQRVNEASARLDG